MATRPTTPDIWHPYDVYYGGYAGGGYVGGGYAGGYGSRHAARFYEGRPEPTASASAEANAAATESCNGLAPGVTDLPIARIKDTVRPDRRSACRAR